MARYIRKQKEQIGIMPGSMVFTGVKKQEKVHVSIIDYDSENLIEVDTQTIAELKPYQETSTCTWVNITGLHEVDVMQEVKGCFNFHPLMMEDVLNTNERPKMEEYDEGVFFTLKMLHFNDDHRLISEQLSLVIMPNMLITFQEQKGDVFDSVRERLRKQRGKIRTVGTDYLAYALLDTVVDNYIYIVSLLGEKIEDLEEAVLISDNNPRVLDKIKKYKSELNFLRKSIRPAREAVTQLLKTENPIVTKRTHTFLRDLLDLTVQANEAVDTYREMLSDQLTIHHSNLSNKMNEIMKVLTIFSAIFIPLTFVAGIYGTNFDFLPELHYRYSYLIFWIVLVIIALIMLRYFKRKGWL